MELAGKKCAGKSSLVLTLPLIDQECDRNFQPFKGGRQGAYHYTINQDFSSRLVHYYIVHTAVMGFGKNSEKRLIFLFHNDRSCRPVLTFVKCFCKVL